MIGIVFEFATEHIEVRINGTEVLFRTGQFMGFTTIDGLRLNRAGVIKEFPDLKDNSEWRKEAVKRFKENMEQMITEKDRAEYIIEDLRKFGYRPLYLQRSGFRPIKLK